MDLDPPPPPPPNCRKIPGSAHESYRSPFLKELTINFLICINTHFHHEKDRIQTIHIVAILSEFNFKIFEPRKMLNLICLIHLYVLKK